jgi:hypothetical protein
MEQYGLIRCLSSDATANSQHVYSSRLIHTHPLITSDGLKEKG